MTATAAVIALGLLSLGGAASVAQADTAGPTTFEAPTFSVGSVSGQDGWLSTGSFDQGVVASPRFTSFGGQSLRISSAVTGGGFGDQTFSPPLASPAGESAGLLPHFDATLQVGTTSNDEQAGLHLSVSPDNGSGARMSYLRLEDQGDGVHVFFDDVTDPGPLGTKATFNETDIATLDRTSVHTLRFSIDFFTGRGNDVVKIFVDGALRATGTTWEDYYRYDLQQEGSGNKLSPTSSLLLRESGTAAGTAGAGGFLVDNVSLASTATTTACAFSTTGTTMTLMADCTTDQTILVPNGKTLDGNGHSITAVDPAGGPFLGAVVKNAVDALTANVTTLTVTAYGVTGCEGGDARLRGIMLDGANGSITDNHVIGINRGESGCQEGNAIEVRNAPFETTTGPDVIVRVSGNVVSDYQKTGIVVNGSVKATVVDNDVHGLGPIPYIAQNGVQIGYGATAIVENNTLANNWYTGTADAISCGLLIYQADGVKQRKNTFSVNQKNVCNEGRGGGSSAGA